MRIGRKGRFSAASKVMGKGDFNPWWEVYSGYRLRHKVAMEAQGYSAEVSLSFFLWCLEAEVGGFS